MTDITVTHRPGGHEGRKDDMKLNNYEEVVDELVDLMVRLDAEVPDYQVDIYLYVDEDRNGSLDTFVNVGGNSWIEDDHITVLSHKSGCYDEAWIRMTTEEVYEELKSLYMREYTETAWRALEIAGIEE